MENDIEALARDVVLVESPEELPVTKTWRYCFMWGVTWALPLAFIFFIIIPYAFLNESQLFQTKTDRKCCFVKYRYLEITNGGRPW
ncbi:uncharacterized protein LOC135401508 isoform X6 [Ornithodoros turicata]|uniref:uncharacterized protein LOC135401508 isoform X6 n=1 Tax=Ornithodoros turicata TaxID=34597 RepID=UPI003139BD3E